MAIEKYISTEWKVASTFDSHVKFASCYTPETYIPDEITQFAESVESNPKFCYAHVIAMADSDYYGGNINGDGFRGEELTRMQTTEEAAKNRGKLVGKCVPAYKTFETAKFFKNHANSDHDTFYGDVPLAVWNTPMRRVELIIRIYRDAEGMGANAEAAPGLAERVDRGDHFTVSMGCRIHHEQCKYCGHENELTRDRCDHLKYMMNRVMPDGRQISADNFAPNFFDISDVGVPAEPIAFSLGKVASVQPRANAARDLVEVKASGTKQAWRDKWAEIEKHVPSSATIGDMPSASSYTESGSSELVPAREDELRDMLAKANGDIDTVIATLTASGVVLSPVELAHLTAMASSDADDDINAPTDINLRKFSSAVFDAGAAFITARNGFTNNVIAEGWEPAKLAAENSGVEFAPYYAYYRTLINTIPITDFVKEASRNPALREIQGGSVNNDSMMNAMKALAYTGFATH